MADISVPGITDYGALLTSFPQGMAAAAANNAGAQRTQAEIPLLNAQATGAQLANQRTALQLGFLQQAADQSGVASPSGGGASVAGGGPAQTVGETDVDPDTVADHAFSNFAPVPPAPPPALMQRAYALRMGGAPEAAQGLIDQWQAQVAGVNQRRQQSAELTYNNMATVASAPAGTALAVLDKIDPAAAAALRQKYADDDPAQLDKDAKDFATAYAGQTFRYTGRKATADNGGVFRDEDGKPVVGMPSVGMSTKDKAELYQKSFSAANDPVTLGAGLPAPRWQALGYASPQAYAAASVQNGGDIPPAVKPGQPGAAPPPGATAPAAVAAPVAGPRPTAPGAAPAVAPPVADPQLKTALNDPTYRQTPIARPTDQVGLEAAKAQATAQVTARTELLKDSQDATSAASQSLAYLQAAKSIMDSKGATVGAYGGLMAQASRFSPFTGDATNYQEVAKYLGNAALANARGIYGNRMTQSEVQLQLNELSPSTHMTDTAINGLVATNIRNAQYTIDAARRVRPYLAAGNDAQSYADWSEHYYPRGKTVNGPQSGQQPSGAAPAAPVAVKSRAEAMALKPDTVFVTPDGRQLVR